MTQNIEKSDLLTVYENETRQNILDLLNLKKGKGESLRKIHKELDIPLPTILWHVRVLEDFGLIKKVKIKREIVYIAIYYFDEFDYELKAIELSFKSDKAKIFYDFLLALEKDQVFSLHSVLSNTDWSTRTTLRYISKLMDFGIIERSTKGRGYKISLKYYYKLKQMKDSDY